MKHDRYRVALLPHGCKVELLKHNFFSNFMNYTSVLHVKAQRSITVIKAQRSIIKMILSPLRHLYLYTGSAGPYSCWCCDFL